MPNPGDQHKANNASSANPFEEQKRPISGYTAQEIATLQSRLNKRLGPEFVSTRPGPGNQKIAYLSAEKAINLANEVFGFNGWSSSVQQIDVDFVEENPNTGKVSLGLSVIVRVTLKDGTFHEDIGYGGIENCKGKAMAFEKSKKEATTDALKRALRNFGNVLGNCMYDRNFVAEVSKVKAEVGNKFDISDLHRHPDFAPKREPSAIPQRMTSAPPSNSGGPGNAHKSDFEDSFDIGEFDDVDFDESDLGRPDEVLLPSDHVMNLPKEMAPTLHSFSNPSKPQYKQGLSASGESRSYMQPVSGVQHSRQTNSDGLPRSGMDPPHRSDRETIPSGKELARVQGTRSAINGREAAQKALGNDTAGLDPEAISTGFTPQKRLPGEPAMLEQVPVPAVAGGNPPSGFYSAKVTQMVDPNHISSLPSTTGRFNPRAESPSIRKTAGVDHTRSVPVKRDSLRTDGGNLSKDFVDPKIDTNRKIGMPGNSSLPMSRAGSTSSAYRPPTRHGSPGGNTAVSERPSPASKRPPFADISNGGHNTTAVTSDGTDAKRQRTAAVANVVDHNVTS